MSKVNQSGFTLLEVLLALGLIVAIAGFSTPLILQTQRQNDMDVAVSSVVQSLRRAQALSQAGRADGPWGVRVVNGEVDVFQGTSYAARDTDYDEIINFSTAITASGTSEINFAELTGFPASTGTITLSTTNQTENISVNAKGMVTY